MLSLEIRSHYMAILREDREREYYIFLLLGALSGMHSPHSGHFLIAIAPLLRNLTRSVSSVLRVVHTPMQSLDGDRCDSAI